MTNPDLVLFHFPGACSRVSVCALEMAGLDYRLELINLASGDQGKPEYLAVSPLGKAPALLIDGASLVENAAILSLIHALRPAAGVFPADPTPLEHAEAIGGMSFCGGTLHPLIRGVANPARLTNGEVGPVREKSRELAAKSLAYAERRIAGRDWWLGRPSIVDVYLDWAFSVLRKTDFDLSPYPVIDSLAKRLTAWPAYARMLEIEQQSRERLGL